MDWQGLVEPLFFDYELPPELIAQRPATERDSARLLVLNRRTGSIEHHHFRELPSFLQTGDLLVLNDTRVLPARLVGRRSATGGKWEGLFLRELSDGTWELICQTRGKVTVGECIEVGAGELVLRLEGRTPERHWIVRPHLPAGHEADTHAILERYGDIPLPPYIAKDASGRDDRNRYQTVYARHLGAVAAPTAGLHFTAQLLERLTAAGILTAYVTLHVGLGTFQPIQANDPRDHQMHAERAELAVTTAAAARACRSRGRRIIAVGTTSVRVLETAARSGSIDTWSGDTDLFIYPPYRFQATDALITNFHLPRTTLLLLVGAFAGVDLLREAYKKAVENGYRFYSYGDAMLVL